MNNSRQALFQADLKTLCFYFLGVFIVSMALGFAFSGCGKEPTPAEVKAFQVIQAGRPHTSPIVVRR